MFKYIFITFITICVVACKNTEKEKTFDTDSYEKSKESLGEKEQKNPARFIVVDIRDRKNLIGQTVVVGHLTNTASICTYKDVEIKLNFYSKTGAKLDEGIETIYETIQPGQKVKFKTKYFAPKGTDSVAIQVLNAQAE